MPSVGELKNIWNEINASLASHFSQVSPDEWFARHTAVSAEDFAREPHRNRLNVLISRTNHQIIISDSFHFWRKSNEI